MNKKAKVQNGLVGKFFHSYKNGKISWQGHIIQKLSDTKYLVQLFEWVMGEASDQVIVELDDMKDWKFYDDKESWLFYAEREQK